MAGRRLNKPLAGENPPDLSVADVAFREAPMAFAAGLFVSTVTVAYSACEIRLAGNYARGWSLTRPGFPGPAEDAAARIEEADKRVNRARGIEDLLDGLAKVGQWISPELSEQLRALSTNRKDLGHYRPVVGEITSVESHEGGTSYSMSFTPSHLLDPERREGVAMDSLSTMFDLWDAPGISFTPGHPPDAEAIQLLREKAEAGRPDDDLLR